MPQAESDRLVHGAVGGIVAGIVVVAWFFIMDVIAGEPFATPARLSSEVLREDFSRPWPRLIALYTVLHFGVFVAMGVVTTWMLYALDLRPGVVVGALFGVFVLNAVHYLGLLVTGTNLLTVVPVMQVTIANLFGGVLMMLYLGRVGWGSGGVEASGRVGMVAHGLTTGVVGAATVAMWFLFMDMLAGSPLRTPATLGSALMLLGRVYRAQRRLVGRGDRSHCWTATAKSLPGAAISLAG